MSERTKETLYAFRNKFYWEVMSVPEPNNPDGKFGINYPYNPSVAHVWGETEEEAKDRAQLFAAAPYLLDSLIELRNFMRSEGYEDDSGIAKADAAISKAGGK